MARIRIAQKGWHGSRYAETEDEIDAGIMCMWVEIDGCRIGTVLGAKVEIANDAATRATLATAIYGPIELVYLLADGSEAFSRFIEPSELPEMTHRAVTMPELLPASEVEIAAKVAREVLRDEHMQWAADAVVARLAELGYLVRPQGD